MGHFFRAQAQKNLGSCQVPFHPGHGFHGELPFDLFFQSEIDEGLSHILGIDLLLHLAVSHGEGLIANLIEGSWNPVGMRSDQIHSPRGENLRGRASGSLQTVLDVIPGFLQSKGQQTRPDLESLV